MPQPILHTCSCGAAYTAPDWQRLDLIGHQAAPATEDEPALYLELRDCRSCGSTRSVPMDALHAAECAATVDLMHSQLAAWAGCSR